MSSPIARLFATLDLETKGFTRGIEQATAGARRFDANVQQVRSSVMSGLGIGAGLGGLMLLERGISAAVDYMGEAVANASDLEESMTKVDQVFTGSADAIHAWARGSARDFGLSTQAALEAAGTFGNFIQALGNTEVEANAMSRSLVELAADLASFNNTGVEETLVALRSGLAGEAEPMRRLGVSISAARVEANILAKGIASTRSEITDAMKVAERYEIIMADTAKAQGDFDRTSDGLANSQRRLDASLENLSATLGGFVLGPAADFTSFLADSAEGAAQLAASIPDIGKALGDLPFDLDNHLANAGRIGLTGGFILLPDVIGKITESGGPANDALEGLVGESTDLGRVWHDLVGEGTDVAAAVTGIHDAVFGKQGYDPLSSIRVPSIPPPTPDLAGVAKSFAEMRKAIVQGFGSIKAALKDPPQVISRADRIENMEARLKKVMRNLHKAVQADDPWNTRYWTRAAIKQQDQLDRMRGNSTMSTGAIKRRFRAMGVDIEGTWLDTRKKAKAAVDGTTKDAKGAARDTVSGVEGVFAGASLFEDGAALVTSYADGMRSQVAAAAAAGAAVAAAAAGPLESHSPPREGPLSTIDRWGGPLVAAWAGGIERGAGRARAAADAVAGAFAPSAHYAPAGGMPAMGGGMGGGDVHIHVGTLIADDRGIDELERRMGRRRDMRDRKRRRDFETPTGRIGQNGRG